jgi:hypothetical protein
MLRFFSLCLLKLKESGDSGGVVIELAITLLFLFFFFVAYIQIVGTFIAHERISYSAYAGARVNIVGGNVGKAVVLAKGKNFSIIGQTVVVNETIKVPIDFKAIDRQGGSSFNIESRCTLPQEEEEQGDN